MIKKVCLLTLVFLITLITSCSNTQNSVLSSQDDSLRAYIKQKGNQTTWTNEIEGKKLNQKLNDFQNINKRVSISTQTLNSIKDLQADVYPIFEDFADLDNSNIHNDLFNAVNNFSKDLCVSPVNLEKYFSNKYIFNYIFFKNDLSLIINTETESEKALFNKYYICKAFINDELIQIPVRFYADEKKYIDLLIYYVKDDGYKICQIELISNSNL